MSLDAFFRDEVAEGETLVCPVRVLWRQYRLYCLEWGFEPASAEAFVRYFKGRGAEVRSGGHGRLRRYFHGVGFAGPLERGTVAA